MVDDGILAISASHYRDLFSPVVRGGIKGLLTINSVRDWWALVSSLSISNQIGVVNAPRICLKAVSSIAI